MEKEGKIQTGTSRRAAADRVSVSISLPAVRPFKLLPAVPDSLEAGDQSSSKSTPVRDFAGSPFSFPNDPPKTRGVAFTAPGNQEKQDLSQPAPFRPATAGFVSQRVATQGLRPFSPSNAQTGHAPVSTGSTNRFPVQLVATGVVQRQPTDDQIAEAKELLKKEIARGESIMDKVRIFNLARIKDRGKLAESQAAKASEIRAQIAAGYKTDIQDMSEAGSVQSGIPGAQNSNAASAATVVGADPDQSQQSPLPATTGHANTSHPQEPAAQDDDAEPTTDSRGAGKFRMTTEGAETEAGEARKKQQLEKYDAANLSPLLERNRKLGLYHNEYDAETGTLTAKDNANNAELELKNNQFMSYQLQQLALIMKSRNQKMQQLTSLVRTGIINADSLKVIKTLRVLYPKDKRVQTGGSAMGLSCAARHAEWHCCGLYHCRKRD